MPCSCVDLPGDTLTLVTILVWRTWSDSGTKDTAENMAGYEKTSL